MLHTYILYGFHSNAIGFVADELEDRFKDVNETASILREGIIDTFMRYSCNYGNETGCKKTNAQDTDTRGRAIDLGSDGGLDLVFVIDGSSSVKEERFNLGLEFAKMLVLKIGTSKRYVIFGK